MIKKITALAAVVLLIFAMCACSQQKSESGQKTDTDAGEVNGEVITADELNYFIIKLRTNVITKYVNDYGVEYSDGFWNEEVSGISPQKYLENEAFDECVRAKIQLIKCREYGIYDDISFSALKAKAEKFNKDNEGKKTVGIQSIDMNVFYTYYIENGALALKNKLTEDGAIEKDSDYDGYIDGIVKEAKTVRY